MTIYVCSYRDKIPKDSIRIETTSRSTDWSKGLSPFVLPAGHLYANYSATNIENAWQYSKVYLEHIDESGEPTEEYFKWAQDGWSKKYAVRYPMGKGAKPEYSYWNGEKLSYIEARKKIYAPLYSRALLKSNAYRILKSICTEAKNSNQDVYLVDFDGYNHIEENISFKDVINNPDRKFGHAFVIWFWLNKEIK